MSKMTKKIFVILSLVLIFSIAISSFGIAYAGGVRGMGLLGISFFLTVGIVIVLAQVIQQAFSLFRWSIPYSLLFEGTNYLSVRPKS
jgi:hypothetical protein